MFGRTAKHPGLVLKAQRADTAGIIHCKQEVDGLELNGHRFLTCPAGRLAALGMVAQDDPPGPTIRLRVSKCPMKNRTVWDFAMRK